LTKHEATAKFDVITLWEVFEHIATDKLETVLKNISQHLAQDGFVVCSIALRDDVQNGVNYHQTVKAEEWWVEFFNYNGYECYKYEFFPFESHVRGTANGPRDANFLTDPGAGFHLTLKKRPD
jgi:SAM-dependent methyltransferase